MEEIDVNKKEDKIENKISEKKKTLLEEVKDLKEFKKEIESNGIKKKNLKIPKKAKVKGRKIKAGWIGILKVDENRNVSAEKQKFSGFAYMTKDGLYHTSDGREILFWQGKFPLVIQPSWKNNPLALNPEIEKNETYGQPYIKAKMLADTIKVKKKGGNIIIWVIIAGAVLFGINYFMGGGGI